MVSVIIPNWNGRHFLRNCLDSLRTQSYQDLEIILVDNGSTDGSAEFVKTFFPEVQILSLPYNKGFAGAVNEGILAAKGEFIALLNNDAIADDRWIEELVKGIYSSSAIGFCASKILRLLHRRRVDTAGDSYTRFGVARKRGWNGGKDKFLKAELVFGACAAAALYRRSMLEEIKLFDEDFFCLYEDVDLSFRAQLAGFKCLYVPTAIVYHQGGGTTGTYRDFDFYYGQRNMEWVFLKNMPLPLLIKYLPLHLGYVLLAFGDHLCRNRGGIFLNSKLDAVKGFGSMLQKRKMVQRKRKVSSQYLEMMFDKRFLKRTTRGN
ncbi:MAG: glycosyltransferase family 2 protein [Candidatus Aminicenantes bacterium]|nr:glycosyltransferase family 2 protein [Candidatus Aminicenantes bacterium]